MFRVRVTLSNVTRPFAKWALEEVTLQKVAFDPSKSVVQVRLDVYVLELVAI